MKPLLIILLVTSAVSSQNICLLGKHHKAVPGPESGLQECALYAGFSCCHANFTEKLSHTPVIEVDNYYWNRCGNLSKACEDYMKKIECFYQCSPSTVHWIHPNISSAIQHVPLCQSFCDSWFEACRSDLVCAHNWIFDWIIDESGNHCKNECIPYSEMYVNGTDLCQSAWGNSFQTSSSPCHCLDMTEVDRKVIKYILDGETSEKSEQQNDVCKSRLEKAEKNKESEKEKD
ncbi:riboflavin-binding protein-like [Pelodytes ibericus]